MAADVGHNIFEKRSTQPPKFLWQTNVFGLLSTTTNVPPESWEEKVVSADIPKRDEVVEAFKVCILCCY